MNFSGELKKYPSIQGRKSGMFMAGDRCFYLYGNRCCEARCELLMINSDNTSILSDSHSRLLVYLTQGGENNGFTLYCGGKLSLRIREFVLLYTIPLINHELCGVISGGTELPKQDAQFTDRKLLTLLENLIHRQRSVSGYTDENFREIARELEGREIKALNDLYLAGRPISEGDFDENA